MLVEQVESVVPVHIALAANAEGAARISFTIQCQREILEWQ